MNHYTKPAIITNKTSSIPTTSTITYTVKSINNNKYNNIHSSINNNNNDNNTLVLTGHDPQTKCSPISVGIARLS